MASSPVRFLFLLLLVCIVGWIIFMFAARLVALLLSRIMGASVSFRVSGCNSMRDVTVKFKKGAIGSVSVGEIKLSLRRSLVKLGFGFISKDPKLQLLISDLEITIRHSEKRATKSRSQKPRSASRGKWMVLANMARFLSVSVTDLIVKMPKAIIEVKNLGLDLFKSGGSNPTLNVKLHFVPLLLHLGEPKGNFDQPGCLLGSQVFSLNAEKSCVPFVCDDLSVACEFGHDRELGIGMRNLEVTSEDVTVNLNEDLFLRKTSEISVGAGISGAANSEQIAAKKSNSLASLKKLIPLFPEKVTFNLPRLDLRFVHQEQDFIVENNIMGIYLRSSKSHFFEDSGEATSHFDVQLDFSEIHLLKEGSNSVLEILKVAVITSVDVPVQPASPIRSEIDVKLGGTQCNLILSRLMPLLHLQKSTKKKMVLPSRGRNSHQAKSLTTETKAIMWTCTVSAPEMAVLLYDIKGLPLYHGCSQSSHLFANNIASKGMQIHAELGELHLYMADEHQECFKENLFGVEANSGSLVHIARVSLDWGHREMESHEGNNWQLVFSVDVTGMGLYLNFQQVELLITNIVSLKTLLRKISVGVGKRENKVGRSSKKPAKGAQLFKISLEQCSVIFSGDVGVEDAMVADPKRVNFGSQGGDVIISVSADGTSRQARIASTICNGSKYLKNSTALDIFHLSLCVNKEKQSTRMELERARSVYKEYSEELGPITKVTLFDIQNAKFVRRPGGLNENSICSLFSATDITLRWEPDVHLALYEIILRLRFLLHNLKLKGSNNEVTGVFNRKDVEQGNESLTDLVQHDKQHRKKDSVFAVDVEMLRVSAELADGVEALVQVQSIFSENARIGILLEGLVISLNEARVFKSSRMQISRLPVLATTNLLDAKAPIATKWDWIIQGTDVHICLPYRLQLRAIEDAVEDTWRGLKLISAGKANILYPVKKDGTKKVKTGSSKLGSVKICIRKLTADIEEEPIQGWLDEHYHLMKNEVCELVSRLKFFDDVIFEGSKHLGAEQNEMNRGKKIQHDGVDIDIHDVSAVQRLREEIHKKSFHCYYLACQKLVSSGGSGACTTGFQAGFKPSTSRTSLLSLCATELDVTLTKIEGGNIGMIEFIKKLDAVALDNDIPFSRLYGRNMVLHTGSLVAQIRNYTFPLFSGTIGKCEGCIVLAQQATCFQPQIEQDIYIGRWRKVRMLRSASGTTPAVKMYSDLPIYFQKGEISFGVGYEPAFADISYAFTVALRRANLSIRSSNSQNITMKPLEHQPPKKERSLPWWDDIRYYIHGKIGLHFSETRWNILGTTNPYEKLNKFQIVSGYMDIQQTDGRVSVSAKEFKIFLSSLESLMNSCSLKLPACVSGPFLYSSSFSLEVVMDWECESGNPLNHYLHALPKEGEPRKKVYDPFRSTSLSLRWNFSLRPCPLPNDTQNVSVGTTDGGLINGPILVNSQKSNGTLVDIPTMNLGAHDLVWLFKCWNMLYSPPHKLRSFSRWPRFGIPRATRSGNLSLDKVMTEFFLRLDATPACIKHVTLGDDDPASGLTFRTSRLRYELCYSRGKQRYTFDCKREPLDLVYQGLDLFMLKAYSNSDTSSVHQDTRTVAKGSHTVLSDGVSNGKTNCIGTCSDKHQDDGFLLFSDYFTIRKQAPKADPERLLAWQESGRKNLEMTYVRSEYANGSESDHTRSDPSDDEEFNFVIADNCQRVFIYGLKLLWTIENRDAVWSWVGGISKAFEPPKPSPSRQYAQRKLIEERQKADGVEVSEDVSTRSLPPASQGGCSPIQHVEPSGSHPSALPPTKMGSSSAGLTAKNGLDDEKEGTRHFMVNVIQPQFNLHSEEANGRFLLAAASGRVLARSFHSVLHVGYEVIEKALGADRMKVPEFEPEVTWKRVEYSVMLEHVQAHVAPTDVDPGAGLQWLPEILRNSPKIKRTGALLERVFMPCQMYFRYTRHKGGLADLKVKPLKELTFNSPNITATMTSRQFQVMLDVLSNLLFARLPKPRKSSLSYPTEDEDIEEEIDEVVPDGVEEVELAKISLEQKERERKLLLDDIRSILASADGSTVLSPLTEKDSDFWMITGPKSALVQWLKKELVNIQKSRKTASVGLRMALQKAAQTRLLEKEKNKSPSYAMRISMKINKVVWSMLADGKSFAEAEINNMIYDFDRDYKDIGVAQFTTKSFEVRNCLPNAKSDMLLSPWNAPPEWGKKDMLRVDAKQGAPKDGTSPLDLLQVEIYPLKIHLTETMYRMMWEYFFPEEEQDSHRRQEVWKVSTTAGTRRGRKSASAAEAASSNQYVKECEVSARLSSTTTSSSTAGLNQSFVHADAAQVSKLQSLKANIVCGSNPELQRTSSFDRTWGENVTETLGNEIVLHVHSSGISSTKSGPINPVLEPSYAGNEEMSRTKTKDSKSVKSGRLSHEEKKVSKMQEEKRSRVRKMMEFHNIKISQVELLVTYEGSRFAVTDLRLLMDTFHRVDFTGTWRRLFSRVKKHIIWGVLKSVTGMQGKKFKDKVQSQKEVNGAAVPDIDGFFSDSDGGQPGKSDQFPTWLRRPNDGAGDGFVTSIKGLFNSQRRKAKAFVWRTMRGEPDNEVGYADWSETDAESPPFARQLTITKAKRLIRRPLKKFRSRGKRNSGMTSQHRGSLPTSPRETTPNQSDSSGASSPYEDVHE